MSSSGAPVQDDDAGNVVFLSLSNEGLRLAPVAFTGRTCTKEWQIPDDDFVVPKGTRVIIPIVSLIFDKILRMLKTFFILGWTPF